MPRKDESGGRAAPARSCALLIAAWAVAGAAAADDTAGPPSCRARPFRWQEDCRNLAGADLQGLDRLRYRPLDPDGDIWLTFGGEARTRMDLLHDIDFGIGGKPGYLSTSGRLLLHADLRTRAGPRVFAQLVGAQEDGRKPGSRAQDQSEVDVAQAFVDLPAQLGPAVVVARLGRQEIDLSANRLVNTRDGTTLRRAYDGVKVDVTITGGRLAVVSSRPVELLDEAFADRTDRTERFNAVSLDLPSGLAAGGALNLFVLDRTREDADYLRAAGRERRYSMGAHYVGGFGRWLVDAQGTWQTGRVAGQPVRAYGLSAQLDRALGGRRNAFLSFDLGVASGDDADTAAIETFDPLYPTNGGISDAPLYHQTNFVMAGGGVGARLAGATWTLSSNLMARHSMDDVVYANSHPIHAAFGHERLTSLLCQLSVRRRWGEHYEAYASVVRAQALEAIHEAGGGNAYYSRVQLTARF